VWRTMKDPALGRRWFWIQACSAPERPAQLLWAPLSAEEDAPVNEASEVSEDDLLVHRGDAVVVSRVSDTFSMRLAGHALEPGELGKTIRVEVDALHRVTILLGTISGKGEVRVGD
jgi:Chaperone for flagella basal body P-ring formation